MATKTIVTKNIVNELKNFKFDATQPISRRIAACLDWSAKECPGQFLQPQLLVKAVMGYARTPNLQSKEVEQVKSRWQQVRKILLSEYERDLVIERGVGSRATYSSEDVAKSTLPTRVRRFENSRRSVEKTMEIVDPNQIINKELKSWVVGMGPSFRALANSDLVKKLLPQAGVKPESK
jgi:hypothetical protein